MPPDWCLALLLPPLSLLLLVPLFYLLPRGPLRRAGRPPPAQPRTAAIVLSQSPANHSPRALAHATALLASHAVQTVIFIAENPPPPSPPPNLLFIPLAAAPPCRRTPLGLLKKLFHNSTALARALRTAVELPDLSIRHLILNTPPCLPALPLLLLLRPIFFASPRPRLTLDWHNLAFSLMTTTRTPPPLVFVARTLELSLARAADNHWAVSAALADFLCDRAAVLPAVVYDRPRPAFRDALSARAAEAPAVLERTRALAKCVGPRLVVEGEGAVPLVVSSTSWTPDEDFSMLLAALRLVDASACRLVVVITGKGPLRAAFEDSVRAEAWKHVAVWFAWLPADDYPRLLAASRLGISLHASSSELDLPMKAVDMLGCGLPVLALRYQCIGELVVDGKTGMLFDDADGLAEALKRLLFVKPGVKKCDAMRENIEKAFGRPEMLWQAAWERDALPTLREPEASDGRERAS